MNRSSNDSSRVDERCCLGFALAATRAGRSRRSSGRARARGDDADLEAGRPRGAQHRRRSVTRTCAAPHLRRRRRGRRARRSTTATTRTCCTATRATAMNGDGKGPSSYGLRPPPRDFTKGIFKFARLRSSDELPNDDDLVRIVHGGLHGTAMLPWDIPDDRAREDHPVHQDLRPAEVGEEEEERRAGQDARGLRAARRSVGRQGRRGREARARALSLPAECVTCHPSYGTKEELYKLSVAAAKREPDKFKAHHRLPRRPVRLGRQGLGRVQRADPPARLHLQPRALGRAPGTRDGGSLPASSPTACTRSCRRGRARGSATRTSGPSPTT